MKFMPRHCKSISIAFSTVLAAGFFGANARAGNVSVLNCTKNAATVAAYNSDDPVMLVAYKSACVQGNGKTASVSCATSKCHLKVWLTTCLPGPTGFLSTKSMGAGASGAQVLFAEQLYPMDYLVDGLTKAGVVPTGTKAVSCDQLRQLPGSVFR